MDSMSQIYTFNPNLCTNEIVINYCESNSPFIYLCKNAKAYPYTPTY